MSGEALRNTTTPTAIFISVVGGALLYVIYATCFAIPTASAGVGLLTGSVWLDLMLFTGIYLVFQLSL